MTLMPALQCLYRWDLNSRPVVRRPIYAGCQVGEEADGVLKAAGWPLRRLSRWSWDELVHRISSSVVLPNPVRVFTDRRMGDAAWFQCSSPGSQCACRLTCAPDDHVW